MKIKTKCKTHPDYEVVMLDGAVSFTDEQGEFVDESTERAVELHIDEGNLYCFGGDAYNHDIVLEVQQ